MAGNRRSLDETWRFLEQDGSSMPRDAYGRPFIPLRTPRHDDVELGFSCFRHVVKKTDWSDLTLPRTFFGRSELTRVDFRNTDLSESRMCWVDFIQCDFSGTDLSSCDMRASVFKQCRFTAASMRGADLRRSSFQGCTFTNADLSGAKGSEGDIVLFRQLSNQQMEIVHWIEDDGSLPEGG